MKTYLFTIAAAAILSLASCQHEIDTFNDNPNSPTDLSTPTTLLTGGEVGTIMNATGNLPRTLSLFTQHTDGVAFQSLDFTNYALTETDNEGDWSNIYQAGVNLNQIVKQFGTVDPYYDGIAKTLLALNISYATDNWGDVPFSQAFDSGNLNPKYDSQQSVYQQMQAYLDQAIVDFGKPYTSNKSWPGKDDIFYGGDVSKWTRLAYGLKARFAMRLSQRDGSAAAAQKTLTYLQKSLGSSADNLTATFDGGNNQSLWYAFNNNRGGYMVMGDYFINLLTGKNDPRLTFYASPDAAGGYSGAVPGTENGDASGFGSYFAGAANTPLPIFTYSEVKFLEAEAQQRLGNTTAAQTALATAISTSLTDVTGSSDAAYVATNSANPSLENIITQKYIALFPTAEPYNDWRRTGYPVLTPNQTSQSKKIPLRLITPRSERTLNANAVTVDSFYTPVWWDN